MKAIKARSSVMEAEDLLTEILVRLPPKPLCRFSCVSKTWLGLISSRQLRHRVCQRLCKETLGLLRIPLYTGASPDGDRDCQFFLLDGENDPPLELEQLEDFLPKEEQVEVVSHCNGLLLCGSGSGEKNGKYYVFNPTTKKYATVIVDLELHGTNFNLHSVHLAFDPRKSLDYKLLLIYKCNDEFRLRIYSSDTGATRQIDEPFPHPASFTSGVYRNGAVNWLGLVHEGLYFNVEEERFGIHPKVPIPEYVERARSFHRTIVYFGESNDHLHLIENYRIPSTSLPTLQFDIYEMERDYSRWFVRFRVDIQPIFTSFSLPTDKCIAMDRRSFLFFTQNPLALRTSGTSKTLFGAMNVVRKDDDEKSFLVISVRGMVFRFNFQDQSFVKIGTIDYQEELFDWRDSFEFVESVYPL